MCRDGLVSFLECLPVSGIKCHLGFAFSPPLLLVLYLPILPPPPLSLPLLAIFLLSSTFCSPLASRAHFGQSNASLIALDDVRCSGNERELFDCRHTAWGTHNCRHSEDAGVACTSELEVMWLNVIG